MMSSDYRCEKKDRCVQNKIFFFFKLLIILCEIFPTVGYGLIIKCWGKTDVSDDDARDIYAVRRRGCQIRSTKPAELSSLRFHTVNTSYTGVLKWSVRMNLKIIKMTLVHRWNVYSATLPISPPFSCVDFTSCECIRYVRKRSVA